MHYILCLKVTVFPWGKLKLCFFVQISSTLNCQNIFSICFSERSEAEGRARSGMKRRAEGLEVRAVCKALGYWDDKSEEKILRTTTDDGQKWHDLIWGFSRSFLFLFLRFFQIFYTKMFVLTFFNVFTLKLFLNFFSMDLH